MSLINDIFREYSGHYLQQYGDRMPLEHKKVINAILRCKTVAYGFSLYECKHCSKTHKVFMGCGNRHCPGCQHGKTVRWLEKQQSRQLPGNHFMITFTVPKQLRDFVRIHQRDVYGILFSCSSGAIKTLAADKRVMGGNTPGFFGVLHTWGRQMPYHPHIHYVVPGGTLSKFDEKWHPSSSGFYMNVRALSKIYKAKFRDAMKAAGLFDQIPSEVWQIDWNVNCNPAGDGQAVQKYLAPYVFKVAISNSRIVSVEKGKVTIRYKKHKSNQFKTLTLSAMEFIRRFLQHVLPTGFMKVRYYGFLHPAFSIPLEKIRSLIEEACQIVRSECAPQKEKLKFRVEICPDCGGPLTCLGVILPNPFGLATG